MFSNPEDSGIDSDDPDRSRLLPRLQPREFLDRPVFSETDSEEDAVERIGEHLVVISGIIKNNFERGGKIDKTFCVEPTKMKCKSVANLDVNVFVETTERWEPPDVGSSPSLGRSSPPLYEVELTASDEDDDASAMEVVIPMHPRYQRVPTSSPMKSNPRPRPSTFLSIFCCVRK